MSTFTRCFFACRHCEGVMRSSNCINYSEVFTGLGYHVVKMRILHPPK